MSHCSAEGVGFRNPITPPGRTREPHHRDGRDAEHEPRPTPSFDEEQHVQSLQPHRLNGEEIDREHVAPVRSDELAPGHPPRVPTGPRPAARSQLRTVVAETAMPRPFNSPTMPLITPPRIVSSETNNQCADLTAERRAPGSTRIRPSLRHQVSMPAKQRPRCDNEGPHSASGAGAGWRPRGRAGRTTSAPDGEFVAGGPQVRAGARRFLAPCDRSIERDRQPAVESAEAPHNTERGTRSLLRSRTAGLFYAFASGRPRIQWAGRAPGLCTLHALAYALGVARGRKAND